jgi:hypothetical protein
LEGTNVAENIQSIGVASVTAYFDCVTSSSIIGGPCRAV